MGFSDHDVVKGWNSLEMQSVTDASMCSMWLDDDDPCCCSYLNFMREGSSSNTVIKSVAMNLFLTSSYPVRFFHLQIFYTGMKECFTSCHIEEFHARVLSYIGADKSRESWS